MAQTSQKTSQRKKVLNDLEYEVARVASDLLLKGNPVTRIAKYALDKKMTSEQLVNFLVKLEHDLGMPGWIIEGVRDSYRMLLGGMQDTSFWWGRELRQRLNEIK